VLEGGSAGLGAVEELAAQAGLVSAPDRVLVIRPAGGNGRDAIRSSPDRGWAAVIHTVQELCEKRGNAIAVYMRCRGICVLVGPPGAPDRRDDAGDLRFAYRIQETVAEQDGVAVRIGVGDAVPDWQSLSRSYREACVVLAASPEPVARYRPVNGSVEGLSSFSEEICRLLAAREFEEARLAIAALPLRADQRLGEDLGRQSSFFTWALGALTFAAHKLGVDGATLSLLRREAAAEFDIAGAPLDIQVAYLDAANEIVEAVRRLDGGKAASIAERACRAVDHAVEHGPGTVSIREVAAALGISTSHLSRTFRKVTGTTFERYLTERRIELAKRLLLDPKNNVTQVAERCGFSDPSYFARVFRKVTGVSPREYCRNPARAAAAAR